MCVLASEEDSRVVSCLIMLLTTPKFSFLYPEIELARVETLEALNN